MVPGWITSLTSIFICPASLRLLPGTLKLTHPRVKSPPQLPQTYSFLSRPSWVGWAVASPTGYLARYLSSPQLLSFLHGHPIGQGLLSGLFSKCIQNPIICHHFYPYPVWAINLSCWIITNTPLLSATTLTPYTHCQPSILSDALKTYDGYQPSSA